MNTQTIKAPEPLPRDLPQSVFLAGSIEMGDAPDWQVTATEALQGHAAYILNPRRDDWDSSWTQSIHNAQFREQVEWELEAMSKASIILMNFVPPYKAPITLLELGLHASSEKLAVCCPEDFWRNGNVEVVCHWHKVPQFREFDDAIRFVKAEIVR